jgi:hypothetical protein
LAVKVRVAETTTGGVAGVTVKVSLAVKLLTGSVPVITAVPAETPVATPATGSTVATAVLEDVYAIAPAFGTTVPVPFGPVHSWNNEFAVPPITTVAGINTP